MTASAVTADVRGAHARSSTVLMVPVRSPHDAFAAAAALLVDLDGTLVDSTASGLRSWTAFAERHGLDPDETWAFVQGRPTRESVRLLAPGADPAAEAQSVDATEASDTGGVVAIRGARELLTSGRPLAIVTSGTRRLATARLDAAGLPVPSVLVTADDVEHGKPDPEPFVRAAAALGVAPADCVVLEDAPAGIAAGRAAGAYVIALRSTHPDDDLRAADAIVDDLATLLGT